MPISISGLVVVLVLVLLVLETVASAIILISRVSFTNSSLPTTIISNASSWRGVTVT